MDEAEFQSRFITVFRTIPVRDESAIGIMILKGPPAAVPVAIPLFTGFTQELCIGTTRYAIILISIAICPQLVILPEWTRFRQVYRFFFRRFGTAPATAAGRNTGTFFGLVTNR